MPRIKRILVLELPPEFIALCAQDNVAPEVVLRGFIADLCALIAPQQGYVRNGSSECEHARAYYERVGHPWLHKP